MRAYKLRKCKHTGRLPALRECRRMPPMWLAERWQKGSWPLLLQRFTRFAKQAVQMLHGMVDSAYKQMPQAIVNGIMAGIAPLNSSVHCCLLTPVLPGEAGSRDG